MRTLALIHRWAGGILGLLLAVIGLSGAILVWEDDWIGVPGAREPYSGHTVDLARALDLAANTNSSLARLTFASRDFGLHQAAYRDGSGAYIDQSGTRVADWVRQWERPELWLFDLHHHLFLDETGETVTGVLGLVGVLFVVTGIVLWWRTRRTFRLRIWPARMTRSAIVRQHRDIGIVVAPLLLIVMGTGSLMVFDGLSEILLAPWRTAAKVDQKSKLNAAAQRPAASGDWKMAFDEAARQFPDAEFRRVQFPKKDGDPVVLRLRQPEEWTPNGRTYLRFDPETRHIIGVDDPLRGDAAQAIEEKFYPLHAAKVGGSAWKLIVSVSGVVLAMLGLLASYSFWFRAGFKQA